MTDVPEAPDWVFASNNPLEIPTLRLDRMALAVMEPVERWGRISRKETKHVRTWSFYTDDYRFERLWKSPGDVVATGARVCVEPNFSCNDGMPWPVGWYNLYRKRWIARFWQDHGIHIIADLYVSDKFLPWNWLGLPEGWRSFAVRGETDNPQDIIAVYRAAQEFAKTPDIFFYVYGGGMRVAGALRDAGINCVMSDYWRENKSSSWLQTLTPAALLEAKERRTLTTKD